jgi:hypothetical protein
MVAPNGNGNLYKLPPEYLDKLRRRAEALGITIEECASLLMREALDREERKNEENQQEEE